MLEENENMELEILEDADHADDAEIVDEQDDETSLVDEVIESVTGTATQDNYELYKYDPTQLPQLIEAVLLAANKPLSEKQILELFDEDFVPSLNEFRQAIYQLQEACEHRGVELVENATGFQMQSKTAYAPWISKLWEEKPAKYSRAFMETLALIAYRQPITRGEIEEIRGVSISSSIFKTLQEERGWIRLVGHRDVPGKPGLYATTKQFLDYFGLKSLDQLPSLPEILNRLQEGDNLELDLEAALAADEANALAQADPEDDDETPVEGETLADESEEENVAEEDTAEDEALEVEEDEALEVEEDAALEIEENEAFEMLAEPEGQEEMTEDSTLDEDLEVDLKDASVAQVDDDNVEQTLPSYEEETE